MHSVHFSFIPSLSVVYKPGSSQQTTKNDKNMAPIWMRDKTIHDPFQSKNIREFFSFLCRIPNPSAQCSPFNSFVGLSITVLGISLQYSLILWYILIYVNFIIYMIYWMLWNPIYLLIIVVRNDKCIGYGFKIWIVQWTVKMRDLRFLR